MHNNKRKEETVKSIKQLKIEVRELKREQMDWEKILERISNIFKTDEGLKMHLNFAEYRWIKRNKKTVTF